MSQAIGCPRDSFKPLIFNPIVVHHAGAERPVIDTLQGLPDLAKRLPIGIGSSELLFLAFASEACVADIADWIISRFPSPFTCSRQLAQERSLFFQQPSLIVVQVHRADSL